MADEVERVSRILARFNMWNVPLQSSTRIVDDVGLDSLTMIQFVVFLEREFDIVVEQEEIDPSNFLTVEDTANYIRRKRSQSHG